MTADDPLAHWIAGDETYPPLIVGRDGTPESSSSLGGVALLPGSFNPLHAGHRGLAAAAELQSGLEVVFELSVANVDKPSLDEPEVHHRLQQFHGYSRVMLTRAPRFLDKARAAPSTLLVLGGDTFARLLDSRYYDGEDAMHRALREIAGLGCRFLVAGRVQGGAFRAMRADDVPAEFAGLFEPIDEARFRIDISSTELRGG